MRFSVHVDAGYLYAALATHLTGSANRAAIKADEAGLIRELVQKLSAPSDALLRVLWYDAAKDGQPDYDQRRIGRLDGVKLRMGRINQFGDQKGVDLRLGLDLVSMAVNRAVQVAYVVSGDDDLSEAVSDAQDLGLQVKLIAVPQPDSDRAFGMARNLELTADGVIVLGPDLIGAHVTRVLSAVPRTVVPPAMTPVTADPSPGNPASAGAPPSPEGIGTTTGTPTGATTRTGPPRPVPTPHPAGARPPAPTQTRPASARPPAVPVYTSSSDGIGPRLGEPVHVEPEVIEVVARSVYEVWATSATPSERIDLLAGRPTIPTQLDRILLVDLSNRTNIYDIPPWARAELRSAFWRIVDQTD